MFKQTIFSKSILSPQIMVLTLCFHSPMLSLPQAHGLIGDMGGSWAQMSYLVQILEENQKRYQQLQLIMKQSKMSDNYLRTVHHGMESITGILRGLPVRDQGILSDLRSFNQSVKAVHRIYGLAPKSKEESLHRLHDQTIAESLRMVNAFKEYSKSQEANANSLKQQSQVASPKGAAKSTALSNALILESLNQLIRLQSQSLKMQSELLALQNKKHKASVTSYQKVNQNFSRAFKNLKQDNRFIRF